ncbi:hypothetical protein [Flavobacterium sp. 5]|uniref:hypothetical protein n=1 Tax=Flavobacterium sp. 5 TaxID=2035199 RepID=UPI000C2C125B|nr:hypothetical protein [Flavobacterium sp. 5]PKB16982.1 hypothetical protein CLU82_2142 [Flavobacterium sp. 5]
MQKKLEADLISIAHRILQLKNKSDINQLYLETQKLYEKLAVLRFVEEHFGEPKPTIGQAEVVEKMKEFFENMAVPEFQKPVAISETIIEDSPITEEIIEDTVLDSIEIEEVKEDVIDIEAEEISSPEITADPIATVEEPEVIVAEVIENPTPIEEPIVSEKIAFEPIVDAIEPIQPEIPKKKEAVQISFDDLLGGNYSDPQFVKVSPSDKKQELEPVKNESSFEFEQEPIPTAPQTTFEKEEPKSITLNDKLVKEITIGLNDRIAFVKHLFGGSNEDYNRVLNQLITFDTFIETKSFIDEMVKPDYNNWEGKEDYENRFMEIIEKKFLSF